MIQPGKQANWQSLVLEQQPSGQSIAVLCRTREVSEGLSYYWRKRLREAAAPEFVEVQVATPQPRPQPSRAGLASTIEVRLSNGRSLMVPPEFDASHLRALLAVVESES